MKVGVELPHYGNDLSLDRLVRLAKECERLGFDSVWVSDHIVFDFGKYGRSDELVGSLEPMTTLAVLGRETSRVRLGTLVLNNELRHPLMLAKEAATVDRLELGIGAGWYDREFSVAGIDYPPTGVRIARLREAVQILRLAFTGDPVHFAGRHYSVDGFVLGAKADVPIWIGAKGPRMVRLAAELADGHADVGWNAAHFQDVEQYRKVADAIGDAQVRRSVAQYAQGSAEEMVDRLRAFADAGVEHAIMSFSDVPFGLDDPDDLARFAQDVLPHV